MAKKCGCEGKGKGKKSKQCSLNHDYCELFKSWFSDGIEQKIIESAVIFWFKDDDYKDCFKLWNYLKED